VKLHPLERSFFVRNTRVVAIELLGKILSVHHPRKTLHTRIVETEAYFGSTDPASHAYRGMTPRNQVMFGPPGFSYVYFIYGNHYCFNIVTEPDGIPGAVLVRAVEPLVGTRAMMMKRHVTCVTHTTNGPGKLTQALGITKRHTGCDIIRGSLFSVSNDSTDTHDIILGASRRIGIRKGNKSLLRFYIKENAFVSS